MKIKDFVKSMGYGFFIAIIGLATTVPASHAAELTLADTPLFIVSVPPNVMVMLDNSGSMANYMYRSGNKFQSFNPSKDYFGIPEFK